MPEAGDEPVEIPGSDPPLTERVHSLELQVGDLNHQLDNLTTELVRLRLKLESTRSAFEDSLTAAPKQAVQKPAEVVASMPFIPPMPPPPPFATAIAARPPAKNLEERLGSQVFNAVGIFALIFGAAYGLKLAIEHGVIGPIGRVLIGLGVGAGLILWSERFRRKGYAAFSYSLKGVGSAILYLSLWAAFHLYGLLPAGVALTAMIIVAAWNAFMAWSQDSELLAVYALVGGFLTPALLSSGGDHETFLFTYIVAIDLGVVLLVRFKSWLRLLAICFPVTVLYFIGWYSTFFHRSARYDADFVHAAWESQSTETALFAIVFAGLFCLVSMRGWLREREAPAKRTTATLTSVLLPLANGVFLACALYSVCEDSGLHDALAWVAVALAAVYLGLMRLQQTAVARAVHLAIAVILLTIAIPLKASGHTLTTAWLVEGIILFWLSTRFTAAETQAAAILRGLSISGYALGISSLCFHWTFFPPAPGSFFNANLASAFIAVASLGGAIVIAHGTSVGDRDVRRRIIPQFLMALLAIDLVALVLAGNEILGPSGLRRAAFAHVEFADALVGLAVLAGAVYAAYRLAGTDRRGRERLLACSGLTLVLFNLTAIIAMVREISALFTATGVPGVDAGLRQSLSTSAFLMLYGAGLLALGFWRRVAFIRWQALALLVFTIGKVFLYDTGGLSQGYRVASFIALGALLMAVSFAYQKDWLVLRAPAAEDTAIQASEDAQ
jgi:uncharacterized membrane protein